MNHSCNLGTPVTSSLTDVLKLHLPLFIAVTDFSFVGHSLWDRCPFLISRNGFYLGNTLNCGRGDNVWQENAEMKRDFETRMVLILLKMISQVDRIVASCSRNLDRLIF